eukprot:Gb_20006 [translate_table: standard]
MRSLANVSGLHFITTTNMTLDFNSTATEPNICCFLTRQKALQELNKYVDNGFNTFDMVDILFRGDIHVNMEVANAENSGWQVCSCELNRELNEIAQMIAVLSPMPEPMRSTNPLFKQHEVMQSAAGPLLVAIGLQYAATASTMPCNQLNTSIQGDSKSRIKNFLINPLMSILHYFDNKSIPPPQVEQDGS